MSPEPDTAFRTRAERIRAEHEARAHAELRAADALCPGSDAVAWSGAVIAEVALVKGLPGPAEASGGAALTGPDGEACGKALEALGWAPAALFSTVSRSVPTASDESRAARLRGQVEAVDARIAIALDAEAAQDLAAAFGVDRLPFGEERRAGGRRLLAVDGFEACLIDEKRKKRVWRQLQAARPDGPAY